MNIHSILNDYTEIKECSYKGEHYSVRDNGAVLRHAREGKRIRKDDNTWTFGKPMRILDIWKLGQNGYIELWLSLFLANLPHLSTSLITLIPTAGTTDLKTSDG